MKWYMVAFKQETHAYLKIQVSGLAEWLEPQYDSSVHHHCGAESVLRWFADHFEASGSSKHGRRNIHINANPSTIGTVIEAGEVELLTAQVEIIPAHRMNAIRVYHRPNEPRIRWKMWESPEGASEEGDWRQVHAFQECECFDQVDVSLLDFYARCRDEINLENTTRFQKAMDNLHQWYDDLRDYVRREHGKEMPQAHGKELAAKLPQHVAL